MELTEQLKALLIKTAEELKGSARRLFMARTVKVLGPGGQRRAEQELGWNRVTLRKGMHELDRGIVCIDAFSARGRKRAEEHLPNLLEDIREIVDAQSQADPKFKTTRLYTRLTAAEVRRQLIKQKGYTDAELPTAQTLNTKLNQMDYSLKKVAKTKPQKKLPETDAIFDRLQKVHAEAANDETVLRVSMDAKASVKVGPFSRGGYSRVQVDAADHDFRPDAIVTAYGLFLPQQDELFVYLTTSKITGDFIVDTLDQWWLEVRGRFPHIKTLVLNQDNGPENHSRRTQFIKRIVEFANKYRLIIRLAYYPPYHSKYNPIERCFGVLETHWNGALLDEIQTVVHFAETMTWKGQHPIVKLVTTTYATGVKLTKAAMDSIEKVLQRLPKLEKWFVDIYPAAPAAT